MTTANRAQVITRWVAITFMAAAVLTATAGGFAQSYAGLFHWALEHGLHGWKADSFPLLVDLFIIVGELGLFLLAIDAFVLQRRHVLSWVDFLLPLAIAMAGWTASLIFNVGHVGHRSFSYQATAAVPPIVSMLGLFVLLRTLHRYVQRDEPPKPAVTPVALHQVTLMRSTVPIPQVRAARSGAALEPAKEGTPEPVSLNGNGNGSAPGPKAADKPSAGPAAASATSTVASAAAPPPAPASRPVPEPEPIFRDTVADNTLRGIVIDVLERHNGDVIASLYEVTREGHLIDEDEIRRISENHWFPYAVYRLMARYKGDGERVEQDLRERGVVYDTTTLEALVRSWRS
ncbi:DUF2637 domain-containing protein [Actinomadura barringtoniae]|uniref:DUF2637 domain-containing protein n=1 Tax=Actinomadura barringtoniae TaxID=1427535 RepID=A0A939PLA9_9ACTN|nr:DUF2637 domain-containing protein [Actinomadura barringtoniae]MBO2454415.1 DUF2637 domain-containing protein [Actinomadura barringtoniae]